MKKNLIIKSYLFLSCLVTMTIYGIVSCNSGHKEVTSPNKNSIGNEQSAIQDKANNNYDLSSMEARETGGPIKRIDDGWHTITHTTDCPTGWTQNTWVLILTSSNKLTITAKDLACPGDYFEVYVDDKLIGTTPVPSKWGCEFDGKLSEGCFSINLSAGKHIIKVRDAGFDGHTEDEVAKMCPAVYIISGKLSR